MVLFRSSNDVSREQILNALEKPFTEISVERDGMFHVRDTRDGGEVRVYYNNEDYILEESCEPAHRPIAGTRREVV